MFGMDSKTLLKRYIIEILDNSEQLISVEDIHNCLGYSNTTTIHEVCKELTILIESIYTNKEFSLELSQAHRGLFHLKRRSTNLQSLYENIFSQDLSYEILRNLIEKRKISTIEFCMSHNVSKSTFKRRIKKINEELATYGVYIVSSEKTYFKANEIKTRIFSYIFLWNIHRQISNLSWNYNTNYYKEITTKIFHYLKIPFDSIQLEILSFWTFIISNAVGKKMFINLKNEEKQIIDSFNIPDLPDFLVRWGNAEWEMMNLIIFDSDLYNFNLPFKTGIKSNFMQLMDQAVFGWIKAFSVHFGKISPIKLQMIKIKITRYYLSYYFLETNSTKDLMDDVIHIISLENFKNDNPLYWEKFNDFWRDVNQNWNSKIDRSHRKLAALLLCIEVYPLEEVHPQIIVYIATDISLLFKSYLQQIIYHHYQGKYCLVFEEVLNNAQLILGTGTFNKHSLKTNQEFLVIRSHIKKFDFDAMDEYLERLSLE